MRLTRSIHLGLIPILLAVSSARADHWVKGDSKEVDPLKKAVDDLVKQIETGDLEKAKAAYAGKDADLDLLKAYVEGVTAAKTLRAEVKTRLGEQAGKDLNQLDTMLQRTGVHDFNEVVFLDDADRASTSADSPMGVGLEFKRVNGTWMVLSLASKPEDKDDEVKEHLTRLKAYITSVQEITKNVKANKYTDADDLADAAAKAAYLLWHKETPGPKK